MLFPCILQRLGIRLDVGLAHARLRVQPADLLDRQPGALGQGLRLPAGDLHVFGIVADLVAGVAGLVPELLDLVHAQARLSRQLDRRPLRLHVIVAQLAHRRAVVTDDGRRALFGVHHVGQHLRPRPLQLDLVGQVHPPLGFGGGHGRQVVGVVDQALPGLPHRRAELHDRLPVLHDRELRRAGRFDHPGEPVARVGRAVCQALQRIPGLQQLLGKRRLLRGLLCFHQVVQRLRQRIGRRPRVVQLAPILAVCLAAGGRLPALLAVRRRCCVGRRHQADHRRDDQRRRPDHPQRGRSQCGDLADHLGNLGSGHQRRAANRGNRRAHGHGCAHPGLHPRLKVDKRFQQPGHRADRDAHHRQQPLAERVLGLFGVAGERGELLAHVAHRCLVGAGGRRARLQDRVQERLFLLRLVQRAGHQLVLGRVCAVDLRQPLDDAVLPEQHRLLSYNRLGQCRVSLAGVLPGDDRQVLGCPGQLGRVGHVQLGLHEPHQGRPGLLGGDSQFLNFLDLDVERRRAIAGVLAHLVQHRAQHLGPGRGQRRRGQQRRARRRHRPQRHAQRPGPFLGGLERLGRRPRRPLRVGLERAQRLRSALQVGPEFGQVDPDRAVGRAEVNALCHHITVFIPHINSSEAIRPLRSNIDSYRAALSAGLPSSQARRSSTTSATVPASTGRMVHSQWGWSG